MPILSVEDHEFWKKKGYVVIRNAVSLENAMACEQAIWDFLGMDPGDSESWYRNPPERQSIMVEIYQHQALWNNRQSPRVHQAFSEIWGTEHLWVSFDRASMNAPNRPPEWERTDAQLHWDRSSLNPPFELAVQGVLYLTDTTANQGAFTCVPGFHRRIETWLQSLPSGADPKKQDLTGLGPEPVSGKAGDLIIWQNLLPHGAGPNTASRPRLTQYITMGPIKEKGERPSSWSNKDFFDSRKEERERRINAWKNRLAGFGGDRKEKEHETGRTAQLTPLGRKLLGLDPWEA